MASVLLRYNARNVLAQKTLDYILSLGVFSKVNDTAPRRRKCSLDRALEDVKRGRVFEVKDAQDLIRQCLK